jgi:hypothetical protein
MRRNPERFNVAHAFKLARVSRIEVLEFYGVYVRFFRVGNGYRIAPLFIDNGKGRAYR